MSINDQKIPYCEYNLHKKNGEQQYNIIKIVLLKQYTYIYHVYYMN